MQVTRRGYLLGVGAAVALAGCDGGSTTTDAEQSSPGSGGPPTGPVAEAPIPETPADHRYATMGSGEEPIVTYVGNWKCPFCADFSTGNLATLVSDYVAPGRLSMRYRGLAYTGSGPFLGPDAPRATRAGLAVWNEDPATYWAFHEYVMANQPSESEQWATTDRLVSMAEAAGVSGTDAVRAAVEGGEYEQLVRETTTYAGEQEVTSTPTLVVGDRTLNPLDEGDMRSALEAELGLTATGGSA